MQRLDDTVVQRLYGLAKAGRWELPTSAFHDVLAASLEKGVPEGERSAQNVERYLRGLHLEDLALACACMGGHDPAWEHLVLEYRPALYRAADAMDPTGAARELADALYAELFGTTKEGGPPRSLFRYFHGRSSLATWLRSVLAQRHVDTLRANRRFDPLPEEEGLPAAGASSSDPERRRLLPLLQQALSTSIARLEPRDRLRLGCYYAQQLTLAEIGRLLHEHEATVSRHLARTRRAIRQMVEHWLEHEAGLQPAEVSECLQFALQDPGPLDLDSILASGDRKIGGANRSKSGTQEVS